MSVQGRILDRRAFAVWAWGQLLLTFLGVHILGGEFFPVLVPRQYMTLALFVSFAVIIAAYMICKFSHDWRVSLAAWFVSLLGYGLLVAGMTESFGSPNLVTVFGLAAWFASLVLVHEAFLPGDLVAKWFFLIVPALLAVACDQAMLMLRYGSLNFPSLIELGIFGLIVIASGIEYRSIWALPHTLDNAVDFAVEFLLEGLKFLNPMRRGL